MAAAELYASADAAQPHVGVMLEGLRDRAVGLAERGRRGVRRLGQRAPERGHEEVVALLGEREASPPRRRAQTTPPAAPEKPTRCSGSPQAAQLARCGAKPAASSSLSRKASAVARVARAGSRSSSASWLASRW